MCLALTHLALLLPGTWFITLVVELFLVLPLLTEAAAPATLPLLLHATRSNLPQRGVASMHRDGGRSRYYSAAAENDPLFVMGVMGDMFGHLGYCDWMLPSVFWPKWAFRAAFGLVYARLQAPSPRRPTAPSTALAPATRHRAATRHC